MSIVATPGAAIPPRSHGDILVPNELEQRQIFHLIKKGSSWTAWNRQLSYYRKWAEIAENSVREADNSGLFATDESDIYYRDYVDILKELAIFEEGVTRLGKGDKRVFLYNEANAFFIRSWNQATYWQIFRNKANNGEIRWAEKTPYRKEFFKALDELGDSGAGCGRFAIEGEDMNNPASVYYHLWYPIFLPRLPYPDPLPELPKPKEEVIIATGERVPYSGIWEPLDENTGQLIGVMNYLHGSASAST
ncbi:MAG: immunity 71 family protein [Azoarcus sp.]|jgi:hypothetical protein|nr:immunity 71 family protein [Azoarcus sp.]